MSDNKEKSNEGGIHFGDQANIQGDVFTGGKRVVNTGGGAYIEGSVDTGGGAFVGRDQVKITGMSAEEVARLFEQIYTKIDAHPELSPGDKTDLKAEVKEVQTEVTKEGEVDESFLARRLRNIKRMAPDILDVVVATLANPVAGFGSVAAKVAKKMQDSAGSS